MPLSSGNTQPTFSTASLRVAQFVQDGASASENCPLVTLKSQEEISTIVDQNAFLKHALHILQEKSSFRAFCSAFLSDPALLTKPNVRSLDQVYRTAPTFWGPSIQLFRNHYLFRTFHDALIVRHVQNVQHNGVHDFSIDIVDDFPFCHFSKLLATGDTLMLGPVVLEDDWKKTGHFYRECKKSFRKFNDLIETFHTESSEDAPTSQGVLYDVEQLFEAIITRQKSSKADLEKRLSKSVKIIDEAARCLEQTGISNTLPVHLYVVLVAKLSAMHEFDSIFELIKKNNPNISDFSWPSESISLKLVSSEGISHDKLIIKRTKNGKDFLLDQSETSSIAESDFYFSQARDESFTNWNTGLYEAMIMVRNWLNRHFGSFQTNASRSDHINDDKLSEYGDRLSRFISGAFRADECTIYKADFRTGSHGTAGPSLERLGGFIRRDESARRLELMSLHMADIAQLEELRANSISYAALDRNEIRYCRSQNLGCSSNKSFQRLSGPSTIDGFSWGESGCSVPLRIQGIPWGVLELISDCPHHFSRAAQTRISDFAKIMSPYFFFEHVFRVFKSIARDQSEDLAEFRKPRTLLALQTVLFSQSLLICDMKKNRAGEFEYNELGDSGSWEMEGINLKKKIVPKSLNALLKDGNLLMPTIVQVHSENGKGSFEILQGSARFENRECERVLILPLSFDSSVSSRDYSKFVIVRLARRLEISQEVLHLYEFLMEHISPLLQIFKNERQRDRDAMSYVSHQLGRASSALLANISKLSKKLEALESTNDVAELEKLVDTSLEDLRYQQSSMSIFSKILSYSNEDEVYHVSDARGIITKGLLGSERVAFDLSEIYRTVFMGDSSSFSKRSIEVDSFPSLPRLNVISHRWVFHESLQILADNILKYSNPSHKIQVQVTENSFNYFLTIANLGPQMDEEDKTRIFREKYRGRIARKRHPGDGEGLGLFWCQTMLRAVGSDIEYFENKTNTDMAPSPDGPIVWHRFRVLLPKSMCES